MKNLLSSVACLALIPSVVLAEGLEIAHTADQIQPALDALAATGGTLMLQGAGDMRLPAGLVYAGTAPVRIIGQGQVLKLTGQETVFTASQGADVTLQDLTLAGAGGWSISRQGDGKGVMVDVREGQTGVVRLTLTNVEVRGVAGHGIHVSDCALADDCGGGEGGAGGGSDASVHVVLNGVTVRDAGNGQFDADGLRLDERGAGDIVVEMTNSLFTGVGADGVELDEGQNGSVIVRGFGNAYAGNGNYCDPAVLEAFLPTAPEGEFADGVFAQSAVPPAVTAAPDATCIEREVDLYDSGFVEEYAFGLDLDDGFDIDEAGPGDIDVQLMGDEVRENRDEGLDFDEEGAGDIRLVLTGVVAVGNTDDGYKMSEEDAGDVVVGVMEAQALDNGGKGFVFEEEGAGDLAGTLSGITARGNDDSDETGVEAVSEDAGRGALVVVSAEAPDGFDLEGVDLIQP